MLSLNPITYSLYRQNNRAAGRLVSNNPLGDDMKDSKRTTKGQFKNGSSGNPAGRPAGSRNKATLACEQLLDGKSEQLTTKLLEMALKGNIHAMRMCMDRTVPARKERCINLDLRPISSVQAQHINFKEITSSVGEGSSTLVT